MWWHTPVISVLGVSRERGPLESMSSRPTPDHIRFCLKKQKQRDKKDNNKIKALRKVSALIRDTECLSTKISITAILAVITVSSYTVELSRMFLGR